MPEFAFVIPVFNQLNYTGQCLASLNAACVADSEVVVVDNGSTDGSIDWLASQAASARVIRNSTNQGFAAANNQGIRSSTAPLIATLNNDALPEADWLRALIAAADQNEADGPGNEAHAQPCQRAASPCNGAAGQQGCAGDDARCEPGREGATPARAIILQHGRQACGHDQPGQRHLHLFRAQHHQPGAGRPKGGVQRAVGVVSRQGEL